MDRTVKHYCPICTALVRLIQVCYHGRVKPKISELVPRAPRGTSVTQLQPGNLRIEPPELWTFNCRKYMFAARHGLTKFIYTAVSDSSTGQRVLDQIAPSLAPYPGALIAIANSAYREDCWFNVYTPYTRFHKPVDRWESWSLFRSDETLHEFVSRQKPGATVVTVGSPARPSDATSNLYYQYMCTLAEIQREFPDVKIIVMSHSVDYSAMFGMGLRAVAVSPSRANIPAMRYVMTLPSGRTFQNYTEALDPKYRSWFELIGYSQAKFPREPNVDLIEEFNYRSAIWASKYWTLASPFTLGVRGFSPRSIATFAMTREASLVLPIARRRAVKVLGPSAASLDQLFCDTCMLFSICSQARSGEVCGLKGSAFVGLADELGSRDPNKIIAGLSRLLQVQATRVETALEDEEMSGVTSKDVTALIGSVFTQGANMAKLLQAMQNPDATAAQALTVNINNVSGAPATPLASSDARTVASQLMGELESLGVPRDAITPELVRTVMRHYTEYGESATRDTLRSVVNAYLASIGARAIAKPGKSITSSVEPDGDSGILASKLPFDGASERFVGDELWGTKAQRDKVRPSSGIDRRDMSDYIPPLRSTYKLTREDREARDKPRASKAKAVEIPEYDDLPSSVSDEASGDVAF